MDKIDKALKKLTNQQRQRMLQAFQRVVNGDPSGLDIKKLKGHNDIFRLRVGDTQLVYRQISGQKPIILLIAKRDDQTYRDF